MSGNGRAASGAHYGRSTVDQQMRKLEQDAYVAVLQAFKAQSEHITWGKEQLMSNLRKELRISDEQHLEFLVEVGANVSLRQIRECRPQGDEHMGPPLYAPPLLDPAPVPVATASRKKQKTAHVSQAALPPPPIKATPVPSPTSAPMAPGKRVPPVGSRGKKSKGGKVSAVTPKSFATVGVPSGGRVSAPTTSRGGGVAGDASLNPWLGRRVQTRWPADNAFYEAVITDYDPHNGLHALVYEMNTENETWEWVDLKELSSADLRYVNAPPVSVVGKAPSANIGLGGRGNAGRGSKKAGGRSGFMSPSGRGKATGRGPLISVENSGMPQRNWRSSMPENGVEMKGLRQIQLPSLDALVKQVDKISEEVDLVKIENIKRAAKEHEEILRKALAEVGESSEEGESDEDEHHPFPGAHSMDRERDGRSRQDSRDQRGDDDEDDTAGDARGDGSPMVGDGGVGSDADDDNEDGDDGEDG